MSDATVIRAVTLPVGVPVGRSWDELNAALKDCFRLSTSLANWCVHQLFRADSPGDEPEAVTKWYGYGEAGKHYPAWGDWAGAMASAQCVIRGVHRKYRQVRREVWRGDQRSLTYRYPYPFPVHNQNWRTDYADGGFPTVTLNLPGHGSFTLRLKRRADFGRQLAMFRLLHDGTAKKGEAALYRNAKGDLLVKLVGEFPRRTDDGTRDRVCFLHTDPAALLVAEIDGRSVTVTNADHVRRMLARVRTMQARHRAFLDRAGQDKKREVRMDRDQRAQLNKVVEARCQKQRDRVNTAVKQIAAQVTRFCERQRVGLVAYDDTVRTFFPDGFPWHALKERLTQLLIGEMGCEWVCGEFVSLNEEERVEWLRRARATATAGRRSLATARRKGSHPAVSTSRRPTSRPASARS